MWQLAAKPAKGMSVLPSVIHYLDIHSGALELIASIVLVLVTTVYTILTRSMAKAATEALRPYVYLDLEFRSIAQMVIVVGNSGTKVASNVKIRLISSNNKELSDLIQKLPLTSGIGHLSPITPRKYEVIINSVNLLPNDGPAAKLDFEITYHDGTRLILDKQSFDIDGYRSALVFDQDSLSDIVTQLREIVQKMPRQPVSVDFGIRKACPYCGTLLVPSAKKCHGCLEWLSRPSIKRIVKVNPTLARRSRRH
jgi:hypothetical protein